METKNKVGLLFMGVPIAIFLVLMVINMPNAFSHCWFKCGTDWVLGCAGMGSFIVGLIFLITRKE